VKRQAWWCPECGARGYVDYGEGAEVDSDAWAVYTAIHADHQQRSPGCDSDVRVQNDAWVEKGAL
jgi:hypothetical protein